MSRAQMTSLQRVLATLGHREPDRVPLFLMLTMHGARELGLSVKEYFSRAENVAEGQLRLRARHHNDCLLGFFYSSIEVEAWGGEVIYREDGPVNSGRPLIRDPQEITALEPPTVEESARLVEVLRAIELLRAKVGDEAPIIGTVTSPLSLPVMQMGFDRYLDLMYDQPSLFWRLMRINEEFCVRWANAQLAAGAAAICYFDPVSSPTITPPESYPSTGFEIARRVVARIQGPTATHMASGRCLSIVDDIARTGTQILGVSALEDLARVKAACRGKLAVLGNLNGVEMRRWSPGQAEAAVKEAIARAGPGGGFILADNHGEIPWQVSDEVLSAISEAARRWGRYPLSWVVDHEP